MRIHPPASVQQAPIASFGGTHDPRNNGGGLNFTTAAPGTRERMRKALGTVLMDAASRDSGLVRSNAYPVCQVEHCSPLHSGSLPVTMSRGGKSSGVQVPAINDVTSASLLI